MLSWSLSVNIMTFPRLAILPCFFLLYRTDLSSFRLDLDKKYRNIVSYLSSFCQCTISLERFVLNLPLEILAFVYMNPSLLGALMTMGPTL